MKKIVRIHKELNRSAIPYYKEKALDLFSEIMTKWNSMEEYQPLKYDLTKFKSTMELTNSRNYDYLDEFIFLFSKESNKVWNLGSKKVYGNIFTFVVDENENTLEIHFNNYILDYIFTKKDIDIMKKHKEKKSLTLSEIEEYKKNKQKYSQLMLFSKTELYNICGKYNKRLYLLLVQFKSTGKFFMKYNLFKESLQIPNSYVQGKIDERILKPAIEEMKKANIFISKVKKIKKGRSIDKIEIYFKYSGKEKTNLKKDKNDDYIKELEIDNNISIEENAKLALNQIEKIKKNLKSKKLF